MAPFSIPTFWRGADTLAAENGSPDKVADKDGSHELQNNDDIIKTDGNDEQFAANLQSGVQKVEATTIVWTKNHMIAAYVLIWLIYFISSTQEVVIRLLTPFVTSSFALHSLTSATNVISSIVGGLSKIPLAKILDTWGRPHGLALSVFIWTLGFIMMAACNDVETYCAAQVFYVVGSQAVSYCITIFIADTSSLRNRGLMLAFATSPYIVTPWIGGPINDSVIRGPGWRWGLGIWAIVTPVVVLPLVALFFVNQRKARKAGLIPKRTEKITPTRVYNYLVDIDIIGILLLAGGMALFLLPISLHSYQGKSWASPMVIAMLVVGPVLLGVFALWEKYLAPKTFIPMHLLADRTVLNGGIMLFFLFACGGIWGNYFQSMLLVVWNLNVTKTTYISNIFRVGSCIAALPLGYLIRLTGRFKWVSLYYGLPLMMLGVGLMIQFRFDYQGIGYVAMTQIFIAFASGPLVVSGELAMMAPVDHQHIAVILAILDLFGSIGTAVGSAVSGAIWTSVFKQQLQDKMPAGSQVDLIYGSLYTQLGFKYGTPGRDAINDSYSEAMRIEYIASCAFLAGGFFATALWRNIKLTDLKQLRGLVV